ncbi:MAG: hypothetical protein JNL58_03990 [Planctomyces sp.]|nr:hypothetical protein [Planctomyces sp.]
MSSERPRVMVLSIGQCRPDQAAITHYLTRNFAVDVLTADRAADAMRILESQPVGLILINRKLDADYSDGLDMLPAIRAIESAASTPVMLVSNFPEWQEKAVALGTVHGFGKAQLNSPATKETLASYLPTLQ